MTRVLLISADYPPVPSGEASHAYYLALNLAQRGADVTVVTSNIPGVLPAEGVRVLPVMEKWNWRDGFTLMSLVRRHAPDGVLLVYLGSMYHDHPMITVAPNLVRMARGSARFVTQVEHLVYPPRRLWSRIARKLVEYGTGVDNYFGTLLSGSDQVIVLSEMHGSHLVERTPVVAKKSSLVPPPPIMRVVAGDPAERAALRQRLGFADDEQVLVYYGYIYAGKGVDTMLRAFGLLASRYAKARLLIVGGIREHVGSEVLTRKSRTYLDEMMALPRELGIEDRVHWTGPVKADGPEASGYLRAADACVLPFQQGIHLNNSSFAAAVVHGLPVVTTKAPTSESVFRDRENVLLCPPDDPQRLGDALYEIVCDDALRRRLTSGASELAREWFTWESAASRTLAILRGPGPDPHGHQL